MKSGQTNAVCAHLQRLRLLREAALLLALAVLAGSLGYLAATWRPVPSLAAVEHVQTASNPWGRAFANLANQAQQTQAISSDEIRFFNGRPVRPAKTMVMVVTAYSPDERSCGPFADGITASGYSVWTNAMKLAAADTRLLPFGSLISVPGYDNGNVVPVLDRGGAIKGNRLDMLYPTHERALRWGVQKLNITVWEYADES